MYPLGVLFGLGFDTATEIALLAIAAGVATHHVPFLAVISLPIIFAAGMSLMDTIDGAFMSHAYGWAFSSPVRKIYYNISVTTLSVAVAWLVGAIELLQVIAAKSCSLTGPVLEPAQQHRPRPPRLRRRRSVHYDVARLVHALEGTPARSEMGLVARAHVVRSCPRSCASSSSTPTTSGTRPRSMQA